ncbi:MAG: hypothetical protein IJC02_10980, partial [Lachnospiraceae bacterium]|nr:hypothetical protein [Lachnospiraceae bacterium]
HNQELMEGCKRLWDYSYFIAEVNQNLDKGYALETAIKKAMDVCIEKGVLLDILEKSRNEVFDMLLTEYDEKLHMKTLYEQGREEGREEGRIEERERMSRLIIVLSQEGKTEELIRAAKDQEYQKKLFKKYNL